MYLTSIQGITPMSAVSLRLPDDLSSRLENLVKTTGRSKTFYMLEAIREHLDDLEDLYIAEHRLVEARAGRSKSHSLEDVITSLGLKN
jgi:RHH-type transcriptional regulator, rel operon repressor / antitoxin RelB